MILLNSNNKEDYIKWKKIINNKAVYTMKDNFVHYS